MTDISPLAFYLLAAVVLVPAIFVVVTENLFHAGINLVACFIGVAGIYVTLSSSFVAGMQVIVYAGAIAVILLFAFMLTHNLMTPEPDSTAFQVGPAAGVSILLACLFLGVIENSGWAVGSVTEEKLAQATSISGLGEQFLTIYLLPFELISLLLLVTLVGAIVIARKEEGSRE